MKMMSRYTFSDTFRLYLGIMLSSLESASWLIQSYWIAENVFFIYYVL